MIPRTVLLGDYPSVRDQPDRAAAKLDLFAGLKKNLVSGGGASAGPACAPSSLIAKPDKVRTVLDPEYGINGLLVYPDGDYGAMDGFPDRLSPGTLADGTDLQDCFQRWQASSASRRPREVRQ